MFRIVRHRVRHFGIHPTKFPSNLLQKKKAMTSVNDSLTSVNVLLTSVNGSLTSVNDSLTSVNGSLTSVNVSLTSVNVSLTSVNGSLKSVIALGVHQKTMPCEVEAGNFVVHPNWIESSRNILLNS
jgi:hypothetical protein